MNGPLVAVSSLHVEPFHSRDQQLCKRIETKECLKGKERSISHTTGLGDPNMAAV